MPVTKEQVDEARSLYEEFPEDGRLAELAVELHDQYEREGAQRREGVATLFLDRVRHGLGDEQLAQLNQVHQGDVTAKYRNFNDAFFREFIGVSDDQLKANGVGLRRAYSKQIWGEEVADDVQFYDRVANDMAFEEEIGKRAMQTVLSGKRNIDALGEMAKEFANDKTFQSRKKAWQDQFLEQSTQAQLRMSPYMPLMRDVAAQLQSKMGVAKEGATVEDGSYREIARSIMEVPKEDRKLVIAGIAAMGATDGSGNPLAKLAESFGRGVEDYVENIPAFVDRGFLMLVKGQIKNGFPINPEDVNDPEKVFAAAMSAPQMELARSEMDPMLQREFESRPLPEIPEEVKAEALKLADELIAAIDLRGELRTVAEQNIDPITSDWIAMRGLYAASRSIPYTLASLSKIGIALNAVTMAEMAYQQLGRNNPDMTAEQKQGISIIAGPLMAATEVMSAKILTGKLPFFNRFFNQVTLTGKSTTARYGTRALGASVLELGQENVQDLTPDIMQGVFSALSQDVPGVKWRERFGELARNQGEIFFAVLPLALFGAGIGTWQDYRGAKLLVSDYDLLVTAGVSEADASEIRAKAIAGDMESAQTLLRKSFAKTGGDQTDVAAQIREAAPKFRAKIEEARRREKMSGDLDILPKILSFEGKTVLQFEGGEAVEFDTHAEAMERWGAVASSSVARLHQDFITSVRRTTRNMESGREFRFVQSPLNPTLRDMQQEGTASEKQVEERGEIEDADQEFLKQFQTAEVLSQIGASSEEDALAAQTVLGSSDNVEVNRGKYGEKVIQTTVRLFQQGTPLTVFEESAEGDAKIMIRDGQRQWLAENLFAIDQKLKAGLFRSKVKSVDDVTNQDIVEAYSKMVVGYYVGRDGMSEMSPQFQKLFQAEVQKAFNGTMTGYAGLFGAIMKRAEMVEKARLGGDLGAIEEFLAKSIGMTEQGQFERTVVQEGEKIAESMGVEFVDEQTFSTLRLSEQDQGILPAPGDFPSTSGPSFSVMLSAVHNLTADNLRFAAEMGGLAVPSIAVVPSGNVIDGFGEITLVGGRPLADPESNPVFDADAYTTRFPRPEWKKVPMAKAQSLLDKLRPYFSKDFGQKGMSLRDIIWDNIVNRADPEEAVSRSKRSLHAKAAFLGLTQGVEIEPLERPARHYVEGVSHPIFVQYLETYGKKTPDWNDKEGRRRITDALISAQRAIYQEKFKDLTEEDRETLITQLTTSALDDEGFLPFSFFPRLEREIEKIGKTEPDTDANEQAIAEAIAGRESEFYDWIENEIRSLFDPPRLKVGGKYEPYTIDNIVRVMTSGKIAGSEKTMTFSEGQVRAMNSRRFRNIDEMRNFAASSIKSEEEVKEIRKSLNERISEWRQNVAGYYKYSSTWDALDNSMAAMARYLKGPRTPAKMSASLRAMDFQNVPKPLVDEAMEIGQMFMDAPVPYFESKPQRVVRLSEFSAAIVPADADLDVVGILEQNGVTVERYDASVPDSRIAAMESVIGDGTTFSTVAADKPLTKAEQLAEDVAAMSADEVRAELDSARLTPNREMVAMLGSFPQYLNPVIDYIMGKRQEMLSGNTSVRDVAKAYWITVASIGADAIDVPTIRRKADTIGFDFNPPEMFLSKGAKGQWQMRPEELAAWWLGTPDGQNALNKIEKGEFDVKDWESGLVLRDAFGKNGLRDKVTKKGSYVPGAVGTPKKGQFNLQNLTGATEAIRKAKGDPKKLETALKKFNGIGEGKKGFVGHMLGFGGWATLDAVELNLWLTGAGETTYASDEAKRIAAIAKRASGSKAESADLFGRIRKRISGLRNVATGAKAIPEEVAAHIIHHWIWDAGKGIETTHEGVYHAMRTFSTMRGNSSPYKDRSEDDSGAPFTETEVREGIEDESGTVGDFDIDDDAFSGDEEDEQSNLGTTFSTVSTVPVIRRKSLKGLKKFVYFSDWTRVGEYTGLHSGSGIKIKLQGGPIYPYIKANAKAKAGWAFTTDGMFTRFQKRVDDTDGIGLTTLYGKDNLRANPTFLAAYIEELRYALRAGLITRDAMVQNLNNAREQVLALKQTRTDEETGESKTKFTVSRDSEAFPFFSQKWDGIDDFKAAMEVSTFEVRAAMFSTKPKVITKNKVKMKVPGQFSGGRLASQKSVKAGMPDIIKMIDLFADPRFDGGEYGLIIGAVRFEKDQQKSSKAGDIGAESHLSYPVVIKGTGIGLFSDPIHVTKIIKKKGKKPHQITRSAETSMAGVSFSVVRTTGDIDTRFASMFSPFVRSPELRPKLGEMARERGAKVLREVLPYILQSKRSVASIDREARSIEAFEYDRLLRETFNANSPEEQEALPLVDRQAARSEAQSLAEKWKAQKMREKKKAPKEVMVGHLRTLDAILRALPAEVRGKIGGFVAIAKLTDPDAMLDEIEARVKKIDIEVEKWLRKEAETRRKKLFKQAQPVRDAAGKAPKGKAGADIHDLFRKLKEAMLWDGDTAETWAVGLEDRIASGELSPEEEAHAQIEANLVRLFADWGDTYEDSGKTDKNGRPIKVLTKRGADAARRTAAVDAAEEVFRVGYLREKERVARERELREQDRADIISDVGGAGTRKRRAATEAEDATQKGRAREWLRDLFGFAQVVGEAVGDKSKWKNWFADRERVASNQKEDEIQQVNDDLEKFFADLAGGSILDGEKLLWRMSQRSMDTSAGPMAELEAISAIMMWRQEDGRRHMKGKRDGKGNVISTWSYDQGFVDLLESQLSKEGVAVLDFLTVQYAGEWETLNPVFRELNGINLPKHHFYSPISVKPQQVKQGQMLDPNTGTSMSTGSMTPGSLRTRSQTVAEPDFRNAIEVYIGHKKQLAHWKAYAKFSKEAQARLGNREVRNAIEAKEGQEAAKVLQGWLDYFAQGGTRDAAAHYAINKGINRIYGRAASMALVGRIGTLAVQVTQLAAATAKMPVGSYITRLGKLLSGNLAWGDALNSEYMQRRIRQMPASLQVAMDGLRASKPNAVKHAVREIGKLLSGTDGLFTAGTYAIIYDYQVKRMREAGLDIDTAREEARMETERTMDEIAQPTRPGTRSIKEVTTTDPLAKVVWAFASEPRKNLALLFYSAFNREGKDGARAALYVLGLNAVISSLVRSVWRDMRDDDDEEFFDERNWGPRKIMLAMATDWMAGIPLVGEEVQNALFALSGEYVPEGTLLSAIGQAPGSFIDLLPGGDAADSKDLEMVLMAMGLKSDTIAAAASLMHIYRDLEGLTRNLID